MIIQVGSLARLLGVHRNTVTNWIRNGKLKAAPTAARKYTVMEADFIRFCREENIPGEIMEMALSGEAQPEGNSHGLKQPEKTGISEVVMSDKPVGSVMVVGGGIAGIQATLDLADSGYYVYLVEKTSGIGGAMAQLDKTFPTNDCAM